MDIQIKGWIQVVEYSLAKYMLYHVGLGQRRIDADNISIFSNRERGFYVKNGTQESIATLSVDEGVYDGALNRKNNQETEVVFTSQWYEYVDFVELMGILCKKLCPEFKAIPSEYIGRGKTQQHYSEQYVEQLLQWSKNAEHPFLTFKLCE